MAPKSLQCMWGAVSGPSQRPPGGPACSPSPEEVLPLSAAPRSSPKAATRPGLGVLRRPGGPAARTWPPPRPRRPPSRSLLVVAPFSSWSPAAVTGCVLGSEPSLLSILFFFC